MKNWKTTSAGISMIIAGILGLYYAWIGNNLNQGTIMAGVGTILAGIGLISAKDHDVTGGSVQQ